MDSFQLTWFAVTRKCSMSIHLSPRSCSSLGSVQNEIYCVMSTSFWLFILVIVLYSICYIEHSNCHIVYITKVLFLSHHNTWIKNRFLCFWVSSIVRVKVVMAMFSQTTQPFNFMHIDQSANWKKKGLEMTSIGYYYSNLSPKKNIKVRTGNNQ